ncbi:MAG: MutS protein msh4 [Chaenotheca gracillima]|nr:MAG: MutS protein msh4 [Chaenotheca gracillima]
MTTATLSHDPSSTPSVSGATLNTSPPPMAGDTATTAAAKDIAFGSIAGTVGKIIEYPFDTVKVRLQSQPDGVPLRYKGPVDCFRQSLAGDPGVDGAGTGGWRGLYRGVSAPMVGAAVETSCLFFSYRLAQSILRSTRPSVDTDVPLPLPSLVGCGAISGAFTSLALTPIELVKCQMQVPGPQVSSTARTGAALRPSIFSLIASIYRNHGLSGFWHGQLGTLIRETGGSAAWFGSYEGVSLLFRRLHEDKGKRSLETETLDPLAPLPTWQQMLAGACAGMSYNLIFFPADTIKSRMQTEQQHQSSSSSSSAVAPRKTFLAVGRSLWRARGIRGLYQGCGITVARSAPSSAFIFAIYEALKNAFA